VNALWVTADGLGGRANGLGSHGNGLGGHANGLGGHGNGLGGHGNGDGSSAALPGDRPAPEPAGKNGVGKTVLTPALSSEERGKRAPPHGHFTRRDWPDNLPGTARRAPPVPSPGGEG